MRMVKTIELPPEVLEAMEYAYVGDGMAGTLAALAAAGYTVEPDWRPIEEAPRDGTYVLVCNHDAGVSWVAHYAPVHVSGYRPQNPWSSLMLNRRHAKKRHSSSVPTHFKPLPAPPPCFAEATQDKEDEA